MPVRVARRCSFESAISSELLVRLSANPRLSAALNALPPKLLLVSSESTQVENVSKEELATRVTRVGERIRSAKFVGKGDANAVPKMYEDYVGRIADMVMPLLAMACGTSSRCSLRAPEFARLGGGRYWEDSGQELARVCQTSDHSSP